MLLPSASVAEVIGYRTPEPVDGHPNWIQGMVNWRQRDIPAVDFEFLIGREHTGAGIRQRIAVCYALDSEAAFPLLGIVAQGIPRLLQVNQKAIQAASGSAKSAAGEKAVRMSLSISGESLLVPDLDFIQAALAGREGRPLQPGLPAN